MADAVNVGEAHNDQFKSVKTLVGFDHQLLRNLGVAIGFAGSAVKVLIDGAVALQPAVIHTHGADLHKPFDSGEPHRLRHVDGSHDIDLQTAVERLRDFAADQTCGMDDFIDFVLLHRFHQRRQDRARLSGPP